MPFDTYKPWFEKTQQEATLKKHRTLVMLIGDEAWLTAFINDLQQSITAFSAREDCLVYSNYQGLVGNVNKQNFRHKLGTESCGLIFADTELNVDALAALSGTLIAGGVLLVAIKASREQHNDSNTRFLSRFLTKANHFFNANIIEQHKEHSQLIEDNSFNQVNSTGEFIPKLKTAAKALGCVTNEQYQAVKAIVKVCSGHRNRPLILTADRGRGKTCALALACADVIKNAKQPVNIIVTAPQIKALDNFFIQLKHCFSLSLSEGNKLTIDESVIQFYPVDELIRNKPKANLLLVDEAAAVPVYLLKELLLNYHRTAFSSTVHGYEGAGRGFTLKFECIVADLYPSWQKYHISEPVRWAKNDPLEAFIFDVCLLNALLPNAALEDVNSESVVLEKTQVISQLEFKEISQDTLIDDVLLSQVFAVLVTAHYQTTPSDLKLLLDHPQVTILCVFYQGQVVAVTLLMREGECNFNIIEEIKSSKRRVKDQFLPQSLLMHCGVEQSFNYSYLRIMRIAVHPIYQSMGIGKLLLAYVEEFGQAQQIDFLGASFGCNHALLGFWLKSGYQVARVGFTKDAASGEHSSLVLKGLSSCALSENQFITDNFYRAFTFLLADEYRLLSDKLIQLILQSQPVKNLPELTQQDLSTVNAFANKERLYSSCAYSLQLWFLHQCQMTKETPTDNLAPLLFIARLLKRQSIEEVIEKYQLTGKKSLNQLLVSYVNEHMFIHNN